MGIWLFAFSGSRLEKGSPYGQVQIGGTHQTGGEDGHHCHRTTGFAEVKPGGGFGFQSRHCSHTPSQLVLRKAQVDSAMTRVEPTRSDCLAASIEVHTLDTVSLGIAEE